MIIKMVFTVAGWMFATGLFAQTLKPATRLDPSQAGKPALPNPHPVTTLAPADIYIQHLDLVRITNDANCGCYHVTVGLQVENRGGQPTSSITVMKAYYHQEVAGEFKPPAQLPTFANDPNHSVLGPWTPAAAEPKMPVVNGGTVWSGSFVYDVQYDDVTKGRKFYVMVLADFYNNTKESSEGNNYSTALFVAPPAD